MRNTPITVESDGITFMATGEYYDSPNRVAAHRIKNGVPEAIDEAARSMAVLVPQGSVLVPIPGHDGKADQTRRLAEMISRYAAVPMADVLEGKKRETNYTAKLRGQPLTEDEMGMRQRFTLPQNITPIFIDNVIDTGTTGRAAYHACGNHGIVFAFAMTPYLREQQEEKLRTPGIKM